MDDSGGASCQPASDALLAPQLSCGSPGGAGTHFARHSVATPPACLRWTSTSPATETVGWRAPVQALADLSEFALTCNEELASSAPDLASCASRALVSPWTYWSWIHNYHHFRAIALSNCDEHPDVGG